MPIRDLMNFGDAEMTKGWSVSASGPLPITMPVIRTDLFARQGVPKTVRHAAIMCAIRTTRVRPGQPMIPLNLRVRAPMVFGAA